MHNFFEAIGFSNRKDGKEKTLIRNIVKNTINDYKENHNYKLEAKGKTMEVGIKFGEYIGMYIQGEFLEDGEFEVDSVFPYVKPMSYEKYKNGITIEPNVYNVSFSAACDTLSENGISIIFYLQNGIEYMNYKDKLRDDYEIGLAGLSMSGRIILPTNVNKDYINKYADKKKNKQNLFIEARDGNQDAMESLAFDEMEMYTRINKRIENENLYSVIDTCFMPYGLQSDKYSIIGRIVNIHKCRNSITFETVYILHLECNDVIITVAINDKDLFGVPEIGRRFKGIIWLQGRVKFNK